MKHTRNEMPEIDMLKLGEILAPGEFALLQKIVVHDKAGKTFIRASKPKVERTDMRPSHFAYLGDTRPVPYPTEETGKAAFLWRWVVFAVSPIPAHHCMPVMDVCDLPWRESSELRRELEQELMNLSDKIIKTIPLHKHSGTLAWGRALGYLG